MTHQATSLCESRLTVRTSEGAGNLSEVLDQEGVPRIKAHCQNRPSDLIIVGGKMSQDEVTVGLHRVRRNALFEVPFKQGQVLVGQTVTEAGTLSEEGVLQLSGFAHVVPHLRSPMNSNAAEEAPIVPIGVQRQHSVLVAKPVGETPLPKEQRMAVQDDFDIHLLGPHVGPFGVGRVPVFQPQLFLPSHPVLCRCKRFEPGRRPVVPLIEVHLAIRIFKVLQLNLRGEFEHEAGVDMLHNHGLDLLSNGPFQILGEAEQDRSSTLHHLVALRFWKVVQRVKLSHNFIRNAPHPDEALLLIKPCNQG